MAKQPKIAFPRIKAGFYSITKDGELVGYIKKEIDAKETNWWIYDNPTPEIDEGVLNSETAIDAPNELFREAKEEAKVYFLSKQSTAKLEAPESPAANTSEEWNFESEVEFSLNEDVLIETEAEELAVV
jgi:hypothetical protein